MTQICLDYSGPIQIMNHEWLYLQIMNDEWFEFPFVLYCTFTLQ